MSNEGSAVQRLLNECHTSYPNLNKIDEYINECRSKNEDMNTLFQDHRWSRMMTPLQMACRNGYHEIVQKLLDSKNNFNNSIDVNTIDKYSRTALHYACEGKCPITVRLLLQHPNIEVNKGNFVGWTPLHEACFDSLDNNREAIIMELLKHPNIQLTAKDRDGSIPLHIACRDTLENTDIIQMLICHEEQKHKIVQLNAKDDNNQTVLHIACSQKNCVTVVKLLEYANCMNIDATDYVGNTPLHLSCKVDIVTRRVVVIIKTLLGQTLIAVHKKNHVGKSPFYIIKQKLDDLEYKKQKQYLIEILQLLEVFRIQQRWRVYSYLINYDVMNHEPSHGIYNKRRSKKKMKL